jgi:hypothetical protein
LAPVRRQAEPRQIRGGSARFVSEGRFVGLAGSTHRECNSAGSLRFTGDLVQEDKTMEDKPGARAALATVVVHRSEQRTFRQMRWPN